MKHTPKAGLRRRVMSQSDAARVLGLSRRTIGRYLRTGLLDVCVIAGERRMVLAESVDRLIAQGIITLPERRTR